MDKLTTTETYLGLLILLSRSRQQALTVVEHRMLAKTQSWKQKFLSLAGRTTIIQSMLSAFPTYSISILLYPKCFSTKLNSLFSCFWWGDAENSRDIISWISWRYSCTLKSRGDLGFKDFELVNLACLGKQCWRLLHNSSSLWVRVLKGFYFPNSSFWEARRDVLKQGVHMNIGDSTCTHIWFDPWIPQSPNLLAPQQLQHSLGRLKVVDLIDQSTLNWNHKLVFGFFSPHQALSILFVHVTPTGTPNVLVWHYARDGQYSLRSGMHPFFLYM
ncbi:hypothetical protein MANES_10G053350v8 [Manihot esculenta]|uniref:Uncharacterized protein n=1 Tax=Manihot esculenta TaxID=3983 RepID=A0ACB7GZV9_MANES|nr:hypothetical protein MANES_10G053350v8 [Manihot esculenta]